MNDQVIGNIQSERAALHILRAKKQTRTNKSRFLQQLSFIYPELKSNHENQLRQEQTHHWLDWMIHNQFLICLSELL